MSFEDDLRAGLVDVVRELGISSQADIARRLGVSRQRVWQLTQEATFPSPVARVNNKPVYVTAEIMSYMEKRSSIIARAKFHALMDGWTPSSGAA